METKKLTRRQRYTINVLQETYAELLQESPDGNVTVVELCRRADVNRSTFYYYYADIADLEDSTISNLFHRSFEVLRGVQRDNPGDAGQQIRKALNVIRENKKLCRLLLRDRRENLVTKALEDNLELFWTDILSTGCSESVAKLLYGYLCGGMAKLWTRWVESDCATPVDEMTDLIEKVVVYYYRMLENLR